MRQYRWFNIIAPVFPFHAESGLVNNRWSPRKLSETKINNQKFFEFCYGFMLINLVNEQFLIENNRVFVKIIKNPLTDLVDTRVDSFYLYNVFCSVLLFYVNIKSEIIDAVLPY